MSHRAKISAILEHAANLIFTWHSMSWMGLALDISARNTGVGWHASLGRQRGASRVGVIIRQTSIKMNEP